MPRRIELECNKLHGFQIMNELVDSDQVPCVRSKPVMGRGSEFHIENNEYYTLKVVKDNNVVCESCYMKDCEECKLLSNLYSDYGLPTKKKIKSNEIYTAVEEFLTCDPDYVFYYYKYFESNLFGKLIINSNYYVIEAVDSENTDICTESNVFGESNQQFSCNLMKSFSYKQIDTIIHFGKIIESRMKLYLISGYSIILDFAFTSQKYFLNGKFEDTNILFYGMRTAYEKTILSNIFN